MSVARRIEDKLKQAFSPIHLELDNESHMHNVPKNSETHFRLLLVSEAFAGKNRVQRQRLVFDLLKDEMAGPVHAFSLRVLTPEEWKRHGSFPASPNCLGGNGK